MSCTWTQLARCILTIPWKTKSLLIEYTLCHDVKVKVIWSRSPKSFLQNHFISKKENQLNVTLLQAMVLRNRIVKFSSKPWSSQNLCLSFYPILKGGNNLPGHLVKMNSWLLNTVKVISIAKYHVPSVRDSVRPKSLHISYAL